MALSNNNKLQHEIQQAKETFEEKCYPFFDRALNQLEAKKDAHHQHFSQLQQKIEEICVLFDTSVYSDLEEDLNEILSNPQHESNEFDSVFISSFYENKEKDFLAKLQAAMEAINTTVTQHKKGILPSFFPLRIHQRR